MKLLNLSLSIDEVNAILEALGNLPYIKVNNLITNIQQQSITQLQKNEAVREIRETDDPKQIKDKNRASA